MAEEASNGKVVEETLEKVEVAVKEDVQWLVGSVKGLVKDLVDGDDGKKDSSSSSSSSSSSDDEKEDEPVKETETPGNVLPVEEAVEEVSETVVAEHSSYQEKTEVPEVGVKEEEATIVVSSEGVKGVEVTAEVVAAEAVAEPIKVTTLTPEVEPEPEPEPAPAPPPVVLPVEEESKGDDLVPKESEEPCLPPPEYVPAPEPIPESTGNPSIIPVSHRVLHPTSWRSCCGLFEVLRRSDR